MGKVTPRMVYGLLKLWGWPADVSLFLPSGHLKVVKHKSRHEWMCHWDASGLGTKGDWWETFKQDEDWRLEKI